MKNKVLTKMMTVILSMVMVLSVMQVCVSAVPVDYTVVGGQHYVHTFSQSGITGFAPNDGTPVAKSSTMGHGDTSSLEVTANSSNFARFFITWDDIAPFEIEKNTNYYISFWYYAETGGWGGTIANNTMEAPYNGAMPVYSLSSKKVGQWNKVVATMTTGNGENQWMRFCAWTAPAGTKIYFDDFEIAKISNTSGLRNTVPEGATAAKTALVYGENVELTKHMLANGTNSGDTVGRSAEYAHWSDMSYEFVSAQTSSVTGTYVSLRESVFLGYSSSETIKAGTPYYVSYYVYCPTKSVTTSFGYINHSWVINQVIPQGVWTKVSALFTPTEALANLQNSHLFKLLIGDTALDSVNQPVYIDDFVIAELSSVTEAALTADSVEYDFDAKTAEVVFSSTVKIVSDIGTENITVPEGVTVTSVNVSTDGRTVTAELSGVESNKTIALSFANVVDTLNRTNTIETSFTTPSAYVFGGVTEVVNGKNATYTKSITKNTNGSATLAMIVTTYNAQGEMISAAMDINTVNGDGVSVPFEATLTKGASYKALVFDWADFTFINE